MRTTSLRAIAPLVTLAAFVVLGDYRLRVSDSRRGHRATLQAASSEMQPAYATYLGGAGTDEARDVAADDGGNAYIVGGTMSRNFPTTAGAFQRSLNTAVPDSPGVEQWDAFVTKLDSRGALVWSTLIGGPNYDRAYAVEVDDKLGFVYAGGRAGRGFPTTNGVFQAGFQGGGTGIYGEQDGFVCKLSAETGALVFCTYFGTNDAQIIRDIAVDPRGDIYLASSHVSGGYVAGVSERFNNRLHAGPGDFVIAKVASDGKAVLWASHVGGTALEYPSSVRVDGAAYPYILLTTRSTDIQTTAGAFQRTYGGNGDMYVAKLTPDTGQLMWATYLGGSENESTETHEFAVDTDGYAYVTGPTQSRGFPTTAGAFQRTYGGGGNDTFVTKLALDGSRLVASTFLGGRANDRAEGVAVGNGGDVYVTGVTSSTDFPVTADAWQLRHNGRADAFATKLSPDFSRLVYSTFIGTPSNIEMGRGAATDNTGHFYLIGETPATNWRVVNAMQPHSGGSQDAFVVKFAPGGETVVNRARRGPRH